MQPTHEASRIIIEKGSTSDKIERKRKRREREREKERERERGRKTIARRSLWTSSASSALSIYCPSHALSSSPHPRYPHIPPYYKQTSKLSLLPAAIVIPLASSSAPPPPHDSGLLLLINPSGGQDTTLLRPGLRSLLLPPSFSIFKDNTSAIPPTTSLQDPTSNLSHLPLFLRPGTFYIRLYIFSFLFLAVFSRQLPQLTFSLPVEPYKIGT